MTIRRERPFKQVDVFGAAPLQGNALAVVHDADDLDEATMQALARWTQLSETTFLLTPSDVRADYRVRIYTPGGELPFAGHPTLGSCHAWLEAGGAPRAGATIVQQCGVGLVQLRRDAGRLAFEAPPLVEDEVDAALLARVLAALGLPDDKLVAARWLDNGPRWLGLLVDTSATVSALDPDHAALKQLAKVGVVGPHPDGHPERFEVRAFAAPLGVNEDPVTGSLNAGLAQWLIGAARAPDSYVASQGARLGRAGRVYVERVDGAIWVGGACVTCVDGTIDL